MKKLGINYLVPLLGAGFIMIAGAAFSTSPKTEEVASPEIASAGRERRAPSEELLESLQPDGLRTLVREALERNPGIARARHRAAAVAAMAPQVRALPDPIAALTWFALPPETRVGPQRVSVAISQKFPWFGKLGLREQAVVYAVAQAEAAIETARLDAIDGMSKLYFDLAFLARQEAVSLSERATLERIEGAAEARYAAGMGLQQEVIRLQAQITRIDERLLVLAEERARLLSSLNTLRDRPARTAVENLRLSDPQEPYLEVSELIDRASKRRPEVVSAEAEIARRAVLVSLAEKNFRPDISLGLGYTLVEGRQDAAGRASPPEGNSEDILALSAAVNLPVRRGRLEAGLEQALADQRVATEEKRQIVAEIEGEIGDLVARIPLLYKHWQLLDGVLQVQAREALRSAEAAYTTGKLNAVDLLDAEVVLYDVRTAVARTSADFAIAMARLERAVAQPVATGFLGDQS
jgi:outer membrane protein TolC